MGDSKEGFLFWFWKHIESKAYKDELFRVI